MNFTEEERNVLIEDALKNFKMEFAEISKLGNEILDPVSRGTMNTDEIRLFTLYQHCKKQERALSFQITGTDPYTIDTDGMVEYVEKIQSLQNREQEEMLKNLRTWRKIYYDEMWRRMKERLNREYKEIDWIKTPDVGLTSNYRIVVGKKNENHKPTGIVYHND